MNRISFFKQEEEGKSNIPEKSLRFSNLNIVSPANLENINTSQPEDVVNEVEDIFDPEEYQYRGPLPNIPGIPSKYIISAYSVIRIV